MTANEKFYKGQRVRPTLLALRRGAVLSANARGTVTGFGHTPNLVGVRLDGQRSRYSYHIDFWQPDDGPSTVCESTDSRHAP